MLSSFSIAELTSSFAFLPLNDKGCNAASLMVARNLLPTYVLCHFLHRLMAMAWTYSCFPLAPFHNIMVVLWFTLKTMKTKKNSTPNSPFSQTIFFWAYSVYAAVCYWLSKIFIPNYVPHLFLPCPIHPSKSWDTYWVRSNKWS